MGKRIFLSVMALMLAILFSCPSVLLAKENAPRKEKGYNKAYLTEDIKTKEIKFKDDVKVKTEQILSGAIKALKEADRNAIELLAIPDSILNTYDSANQYVYDITKEYKGDEDDTDLESLPPGQLKKVVDDCDLVRSKEWGWYWAQENKSKRDKIEDKKWNVFKITRKLAWKHYRLAIQLHSQLKYADAKTQCLIAIWFWPQFVEAHTQLGIENLCLTLPSEAELNFRRAVKIAPDFGMAYYGLSIAYLMKTPVQLFDSVEAIQYARELEYTGEQDFYEFVMLIANLPKE
jgi:hypothetical protein